MRYFLLIFTVVVVGVVLLHACFDLLLELQVAVERSIQKVFPTAFCD